MLNLNLDERSEMLENKSPGPRSQFWLKHDGKTVSDFPPDGRDYAVKEATKALIP